MSKPKIYLAGKIGKNDWRHSLIPELRGREWQHGPIEMPNYSYVGPFFVSCDHGCNHVLNSHGASAGYAFGESPYTQRDVIQNNNTSLEQADLLFAYVTSCDCYGTLIEIGYSLRAVERVVIAFAHGIPHKDFWYADQQATRVHYEVRACCLPGLLAIELETLK